MEQLIITNLNELVNVVGLAMGFLADIGINELARGYVRMGMLFVLLVELSISFEFFQFLQRGRV